MGRAVIAWIWIIGLSIYLPTDFKLAVKYSSFFIWHTIHVLWHVEVLIGEGRCLFRSVNNWKLLFVNQILIQLMIMRQQIWILFNIFSSLFIKDKSKISSGKADRHLTNSHGCKTNRKEKYKNKIIDIIFNCDLLILFFSSL